jgi:hypothetical protein
MPNQSDPNQNQQTTNPQEVITPPAENNPQIVVPDFQTTEIPSIPTGAVEAPPKPPDVPETSAPIEVPPPIISSTPKKKFGGGKIIATILGFLILAGGIVGGVILTQQQQDIRERAANDAGGGGGGSTGGTTGGGDNDDIGGGDDDDGGSTGGGGNDQIGSGGSGSGTSGGAGSGTNNQPAGMCIDVNCALTVDSNGGYHYNSSLDQPIYNPDTGTYEDEEVDGMPVYDYYVSVTTTGDGTGGLGDSCENDSYCANGYTCVGGTCQGNPTTTTCGRDQDMAAPVCCTGGCGGSSGGSYVCEEGNRLECNNGGVHCTIDAESSSCQGVNPGEPPDNPPSTTTSTSSAQCLDVKAYSSTWVLLTLTQLSDLKPTNVVNFCVVGSASSGTFDQAEFKIGSAAKTNVTTPSARPGSTNEYCQPYTIAPTDTTISVKARIHHPTLGWFGESI